MRAIATGLVALHLFLRALGLAEHTSAFAGMPPTSWSNLLGPLYAIVYFLAVIVAPVVLLASLLERITRARWPRP